MRMLVNPIPDVFKLLILIIFINSVFTQNTTDCGKEYGCFLYPEKCKNQNCKFIHKWKSVENATKTHFIISGKMNGNFHNRWLGIGFSNDDLMGEDGIVFCKTNQQLLHSYVAFEAYRPQLIDSNKPEIGIENIRYKQDDGFFVCSFTRLNSMDLLAYKNLNNPLHIFAAIGDFNETGWLSKHKHEDRVSSPGKADFKRLGTLDGSFNLPKEKVHGCLMVIAWVLFASIGMLFGRYYKYFLSDDLICGVQFWFVVHRPLMLSVSTLTIISFIIILSDEHWKWIRPDEKLEFAHSIFGILTIVLAAVQPFIAFARCDKDSTNRYIFNYTHRIIAILSFLFSIVAMILGSLIGSMKMGNNGWLTLLAWSIWVVLFIFVMEFSQYKHKVTNIHGNEMKKLSKFKNKLLVLHLLASFAITTALIVLIIRG